MRVWTQVRGDPVQGTEVETGDTERIGAIPEPTPLMIVSSVTFW